MTDLPLEEVRKTSDSHSDYDPRFRQNQCDTVGLS